MPPAAAPASDPRDTSKRAMAARNVRYQVPTADGPMVLPTLGEVQDEIERRGKLPGGNAETLARRATRAAEAAEEAVLLRDLAGYHETHGNNPYGAQADRIMAAEEERKAAELAALPDPVVRGIGGEVALREPLGHDAAGQYFKDTLISPTTTAAAASRARMQQASDHGVRGESLAQALDAAETVGARDSIERMASHQLAVAHALVMQLFRDGDKMIRDGRLRSDFKGSAFYNVEGCRMLTTAARLMAAYQAGHATLARIRQGGRQVVTVQHVQVNDGGQAVVAGQVTPAPAGGRGSLPGEGSKG